MKSEIKNHRKKEDELQFTKFEKTDEGKDESKNVIKNQMEAYQREMFELKEMVHRLRTKNDVIDRFFREEYEMMTRDPHWFLSN